MFFINYKQATILITGIGAINWLLIGLLGLNLVNTFLGWMPILERIVYIVVGLCGLVIVWENFTQKKGKKRH